MRILRYARRLAGSRESWRRRSLAGVLLGFALAALSAAAQTNLPPAATTDTAFFVRALAGVSKAAISSVIQFACTIHYINDQENHADSCVAVLYQSRELREDLAREALAQAVLDRKQLMWLGRPARENNTLPTWDHYAEGLIKEGLESSGALKKLQGL